jgi:hypothetical protein
MGSSSPNPSLAADRPAGAVRRGGFELLDSVGYAQAGGTGPNLSQDRAAGS